MRSNTTCISLGGWRKYHNVSPGLRQFCLRNFFFQCKGFWDIEVSSTAEGFGAFFLFSPHFQVSGPSPRSRQQTTWPSAGALFCVVTGFQGSEHLLRNLLSKQENTTGQKSVISWKGVPFFFPFFFFSKTCDLTHGHQNPTEFSPHFCWPYFRWTQTLPVAYRPKAWFQR